MVGQLGHTDTASYRNPRRVVFFDGIPVREVACGDEFTAILAGMFELPESQQNWANYI